MTTYHEITETRHYEYRYWYSSLIEGEKRPRLTGWQDAGPASPETLNKIIAALSDVEYEVREVVQPIRRIWTLYRNTDLRCADR